MNQKWVKIISRVIIALLVLTMLAGMILPVLGGTHSSSDRRWDRAIPVRQSQAEAPAGTALYHTLQVHLLGDQPRQGLLVFLPAGGL